MGAVQGLASGPEDQSPWGGDRGGERPGAGVGGGAPRGGDTVEDCSQETPWEQISTTCPGSDAGGLWVTGSAKF